VEDSMNILPKILYFVYHKVKERFKSKIDVGQTVTYKTQNKMITTKVVLIADSMATIAWMEGKDGFFIKKTALVPLSDLTIVEKK
jgi:hypothetical protein